MREAIHDYLCARPSGATSAELLDLIFARRGSDPELGPRIVHSLLGEDRRFVFDEDRQRWRAAVHQCMAVALDDASFVVVDLETTGGRPDRGQAIIEVGAVKVFGGRAVDTFQSLVDPGRRLPSFITRLTGITDAMLAGEGKIEEVLPAFASFAADSVLVAHNASFDRAFLDAAWRAVLDAPIPLPFLCTLRLARRLLPGVRRRSLDALAGHYGIPAVDRHRALGDARMTTEVLFHFLEMLPRRGIVQVGELLDFQGAASDGRRFFCALPRSAVAALPHRPGVYRFFDSEGELLYIGKAVDLRQRVSSYLSNSKNHSRKTLELIRCIRRVEVEECASELEAALHEAEAIRAEQPPYNVLRRHLPRIAYLKLNVADPFPRLSLATRPSSGRARYFGPFRTRAHAQRALDVLVRTFRLRTCSGRLRPAEDVSPCFQGQIGHCTLPCNTTVGAMAYAEQVETFVRFFSGEATPAVARLEQRRDEWSAALRFEAAAGAQRDLDMLRHLQARQKQLSWVVERHDFIVVEPNLSGAALNVYCVVHGRLVERAKLADTGDLQRLVTLIGEHAGKRPAGIGAQDVDGTTILAAWLRDRGESDGYVIPIDAASDRSDRVERLPAWATALQVLLSGRATERASA